MIIYEKRVPAAVSAASEQAGKQADEGDEAESKAATSSSSNDDATVAVTTPTSPPPIFVRTSGAGNIPSLSIPHKIYAECADENRRYLHDKNVFGEEYADWIHDIVSGDQLSRAIRILNRIDGRSPNKERKIEHGKKSSNSDDANASDKQEGAAEKEMEEERDSRAVLVSAAKIVCCFTFDVLAHAREPKRRLKECVEWLERLLPHLPEVCHWFLSVMADKSRPWHRAVLLFCPSYLVRSALHRLVMLAIGTVLESERPLYGDLEPEDLKPLPVACAAAPSSAADGSGATSSKK